MTARKPAKKKTALELDLSQRPRYADFETHAEFSDAVAAWEEAVANADPDDDE